MTGAPTPFGVDEAQLPGRARAGRGPAALRVIGFHLHAVSNNLDARRTRRLRRRRPRAGPGDRARHRHRPALVNAGGGLGVDYLSDATIDLAELRAACPTPATCELIVEPGRILAADAGWYAAEVLDLKHTHGR